jgi:hypothetical protein
MRLAGQLGLNGLFLITASALPSLRWPPSSGARYIEKPLCG